MKLLEKNEAKLAWANGEPLLINNNGWTDFHPLEWSISVFEKYEFALKPREIQIGEMLVPEPIREAPKKGTVCFSPSILTEKAYQQFKWRDSKQDKLLLERGMVHLDVFNVIKHAVALVRISGGSCVINLDAQSENPVIEASTDIPDPSEVEKEQSLELTSESNYEVELKSLLDELENTTSPGSANDLVSRTRHWSEEQRKPLLDAINKRLTTFTQPQAKEPPSLMVQIQTAPDLATLDILEVDIGGKPQEIQTKLMDFVKKRRFELTQTETTAGA
ncbi:hypothetical protein L2Z47_04005 [Acinetobacter baumannii]|uniref:hypothetical protein n=1 Tax=Acinetobacter baumannii TaxID=470 RepID=UPI000CE344FF|nr:hypothetical protein [Acinetobacter baumannii]EKW4079210.1 hypothetical protein [Acinetobacter baumannii]MBU0403831.1 hypothetical protein [Acinetobacter baumannii]PPC17017.1 hypothetical protein AbaHC9436_15960 [Acinetobacter baumannii]UMN02955.1 hypothetical protein L2Z47_04005 [Acinetobacter baumannii]HAV3045199.1 hypothetical protein [Acinetobacter baumannii]